ncbi:MAG: DNA polymerase III subunit delta' [Rhodospirillales bacterium]
MAAASDDEETIPHPRKREILLGHEAAEKTLLDAFASGRLPHAWLISGPRGIGKATLAYRFARFLLAGGGEGGLFGAPQDLAVPAQSPVFRRVAMQSHADLRTVERVVNEKGKLRSEIVVDGVRDLSSFLRLTPGEGGWRIAIVDAADEMNRNAANALLKILEEPPDRAVLLVVSHAPGRLLPTIRSRCRKLPLQPLAEDQVLQILRELVPDLGPDEQLALARLSGGSPGRALELAAAGSIDLFRAVSGILGSLPKLDLGKLHTLADRMARPGADGDFRTLGFVLGWWLETMVRSGARGEGAVEILPGDAAIRAKLEAAASLDRWVDVWEKIGQLFARADAVNLDRKQVVLGSFLALEAAARL